MGIWKYTNNLAIRDVGLLRYALQLLGQLLEITHDADETFRLRPKFQQTLLPTDLRRHSRHHPIGKLRIGKDGRRSLQ